CGVCEPECPAEAIVPDSARGAEQWIEHNRTFANQWPNITRKGTPPADADQWKGAPDKFSRFFSPIPGRAATKTPA
ncbi:MAG: DUF3470 domain-containing protein, partial [Blastocatellia bacterium]